MLNRFLKAINPVAPIPLTERIALFLYIRLLDPFLASPPPLTVIRVILVSFHCLPKLIFLFCTKGLNFGASGRSVSLPPIPPVKTRVYCYTQWVGGLSFLKTCCSSHFIIYVSQISMLYTLNLYSAVCQLLI